MTETAARRAIARVWFPVQLCHIRPAISQRSQLLYASRATTLGLEEVFGVQHGSALSQRMKKANGHPWICSRSTEDSSAAVSKHSVSARTQRTRTGPVPVRPCHMYSAVSQ